MKSNWKQIEMLLITNKNKWKVIKNKWKVIYEKWNVIYKKWNVII